MNKYDRWKLDTPPEYDNDMEKECFECGKPMDSGSKGDYCSRKCELASML